MTIAMQPEADATTETARRELPPSMVERMTLILDTFPGRESRHTLEEIARMTHLPRSTAHRILDQLVRLEWLEHTSFGYSLGRRSLGLGGGADDHSELRAAAAPHLHEILLRTGAVVHLAVLDGSQVRYLDKMGGRFASVVPSRVGGWAPAHCTALGKAMLAWIEPEEVDLLVGDELSARTPSTIAELDSFHHELGRIRSRHGLALEVGECFENIACAAAAVRGPRGPVAALSVVGEAGMPVERVAPLVVNAARLIGQDLFGDLPAGRRLASVR
ncbi:IclR family transcriptional regulator [Nocardioides daejeonensis]|uniref:IclR family transcriptional regulator n=1 Tax=Nocardioides daejeonensis TaxID=1046556 RepID=UPI001951CA53|nr:IclR family transcriptional regulator [Nocardioides daejeonensis]